LLIEDLKVQKGKGWPDAGGQGPIDCEEYVALSCFRKSTESPGKKVAEILCLHHVQKNFTSNLLFHPRL
jgi:hypothetical protein